MAWNVTFYDDETGTAYRVRVKRLTVGDAVAADMLGDDIARRDDLRGRELLTLSQTYPFVRYATALCERAVLDDAPTEKTETGEPVIADDAAWEPFDLTEGVFRTLPEFLMLRWQHEAILKNPHRDPTYEALKKKWLREKLTPANEPPTNDGGSSATSSEGVS